MALEESVNLENPEILKVLLYGSLAGSCQILPLHNAKLLPEKWAKTSVVVVLQEHHNPTVLIVNCEVPDYAV